MVLGYLSDHPRKKRDLGDGAKVTTGSKSFYLMIIKHKLMHAMQVRDSHYFRQKVNHVDDAYFSGEFSGGKAGRGSENKVSFVAAVEVSDDWRPIHIKMDRVRGFTSEAMKDWAKKRGVLRSAVLSDSLACFRATANVGCQHIPEVMGGWKPKESPIFQWLNTIIENVKTGLSGIYHAFNFRKY